MRLVLVIAGLKLALHLACAGRYGYFGDELYHLACSRHLAWGYVDQPPLIAVVGWLVRHTLGDSLFAVRLVPALAGAALVVASGLLARQLGGGRLGMALAALSTACMPVMLVMHSLFTMNAFEPLFWTLGAGLVLHILRGGDPRWWLAFGALAGLGLLNKYSTAVFGAGIVLGLLLTPARRVFVSPWIWLGGVLAGLMFLPNVLWNVAHGWPFLELMSNIREQGRDVRLGPLDYLAAQVFLAGPVNALVSLAGGVHLARGRTPGARVLAWCCAFVLVFFIASGGKDYYAAPVFPIALAAGGVALAASFERRARTWLAGPVVLANVAVTAVLLPLLVPVLAPARLTAYIARLPFELPASEHSHRAARLPHHFAWQFGWEELVRAVAQVYHGLSPEERAQAAIFGGNFAQAGAIDLLGPRYGLPPAIGGHQSYWLWGPRGATGRVLIVLGDTPERLARSCDSVSVGALLEHPYARPSENRPVLVCRNTRAGLAEAWPRLKRWN